MIESCEWEVTDLPWPIRTRVTPDSKAEVDLGIKIQNDLKAELYKQGIYSKSQEPIYRIIAIADRLIESEDGRRRLVLRVMGPPHNKPWKRDDDTAQKDELLTHGYHVLDLWHDGSLSKAKLISWVEAIKTKWSRMISGEDVEADWIVME